MNKNFEKSFNETAKELRQVGNEVVMKKAVEAFERGDLSWHQLETLELGLQRGRRCSPEFLRSLGIDVEGRPTRQEALAAMAKSLERREITFKEFAIGEDQLNKGIETPETVLKALETRRREDKQQDEQRLEKAKKPTIRVTEKREVPVSLLMGANLTSEQETLLQNLDVEPWFAVAMAKSFRRGKFL